MYMFTFICLRLHVYVYLLQNPQFTNATTYVIFAHLLRQIASLSDHDHHFIVHWFKRSVFVTIVTTIIPHI